MHLPITIVRGTLEYIGASTLTEEKTTYHSLEFTTGKGLVTLRNVSVPHELDQPLVLDEDLTFAYLVALESTSFVAIKTHANGRVFVAPDILQARKYAVIIAVWATGFSFGAIPIGLLLLIWPGIVMARWWWKIVSWARTMPNKAEMQAAIDSVTNS